MIESFNLLKVDDNYPISHEILNINETIYVRNEEIKRIIEKMIEETSFAGSCVVSDEFDW